MASRFGTILFFIFFMLCLFAFAACSGEVPAGAPGTDGAAAVTAAAGDRQYLPAAAQNDFSAYLSDKNKTYLIYAVNSVAAGLVAGDAVQDVSDGRGTSAVTATAKTGYRFVRWSDGSAEPRRSGDTAASSAVLTAVFDYDLLGAPAVLIDTETGRDVESRSEYIAAGIRIIGCGEEYETPVLEARIRGRGNNSWSYEKKSYKIKLAGKENLLGIGRGKAKTWVLLANMCDQSLLRNRAAFEFSRSLSGIAFAPASHTADVYLNGEYRGVYLLAEEVEIDKNRLDIDESTDGTDIGYLVKLSYYAEDDTVFNLAGRQYHIVSDLSEDAGERDAQRDFIIGTMNEAWEAVKSGDRERVEALVGIGSFVDTYIAEEVLKNLDFGFDSFYLHKDKGGKLCFGPIWDFDLSLGNANETCEYYTDFYAAVDTGNGLGNPWFFTVMKHAWFRELVRARWNELGDELRSVSGTVLAEGEKYNGAFERNFIRWPIFGRVMNRETGFITALKTYDEHYRYLAEWAENRIAWLDEHIRADSFTEGSSGGEKFRYGNGTTSLIPEKFGPLNTLLLPDSVSGTEGFENEGPANAFDGVAETKYCFSSTGESELYFALSEPATVRAVMFMTANDTADYPERNPDAWTLYGRNSPADAWSEAGSVPDAAARMGTANFTYYGMTAANTESYIYYRLVITDPGIVQFAELSLWGEKE